jgi:thiol:disulfide interchange protein
MGNLPTSRRFSTLAWTILLLASILSPALTPAEAADGKPAKKDSRAGARPKEATFTTTVTPAEAKPGDTVTYKVTAKVEAPWHIYKYSKTPLDNGPKYTEFDFFDPAGLKLEGDWSPSSPPIKKKEPAYPDIPFLEYHEEEVTWTIKLQVPPKATAGKKTLRCQIGYMICSDQNCSFPGQWTLPDAEVTVLPASKLLNRRIDALIPVLVGLVPQTVTEQAQPKERDTAPIVRPKSAKLEFSTEVTPSQAKAGETVRLKVTGKVAPPWHIYKYAKEKLDDGPTLTSFDLFDTGGLVPKADWEPSRPPIKKKDPVFEKLEFLEFYEGEVSWSLPLEVPKDAQPGKKSIKAQISFQICTDKVCSQNILWTLPTAELEVVPGKGVAAAVVAPPPATTREQAPLAPSISLSPGSSPKPIGDSDTPNQTNQGIIPFLLFCAGGGLFALAMPCVWPMIPVTVNFFVKQGQKNNGSTTGLAIAYCLSIILTFMAIGLCFSIFFGAASLSKLANSPWLNFGVAALFLVFGLSLLGLFELRLPNFLLNASSQGESKGGMIGVMFMALTLTITSFTCTFPVVGLLLVMAANGQILYPVIGLATFASVLAFPFLLLALSPGLLAKMPKSGDWMNTVKVVGGLVEIAAAFKFINTAEVVFVVPSEAWFNAYTVLAIWVVMALICGIYLLGLFRTDHDYEEVKVGPGRIIGGWVFLSLALFLAPALFGRPPQNKIWFLFAGLLPADAVDLQAPAGVGGGGESLAKGAISSDPKAAEREQTSVHGVVWGMSLEGAFEKAKTDKKPILIDFTGVNCPNCRVMELEVFPRQEVIQTLGDFVTVQLYTDVVPIKSISPQARLDLAKNNFASEIKYSGEVTNPNYVALDSDGTILGKLGGKVPASEFVEFLKGALTKFKESKSTAKEESTPAPAKEATSIDPKRAEREQTEFHGVEWGLNYEAALKKVEQNNRPLLIFFGGVNDANSRVMEHEVLTRPAIVEALRQFVTLKLYIDIVPIQSIGLKARSALARANLERQVELIDEVNSPCFAALDSEGVLQGSVCGKVSLGALARFLQEMQAACYNPMSQTVL